MKVLLALPTGLGDIVLSQSLCQLLKLKFNGCVLDAIATPYTKPIIDLLPEINCSHVLNINRTEQGGLCKRIQLGRALHHCGYQKAYVLGLNWMDAVIPFVAGIPHRIGWNRGCRFFLLNDRKKYVSAHMKRLIDRIAGLAYSEEELRVFEGCLPVPRPKLTISKELQTATLQKFNLQPEQQPYLLFCPGSSPHTGRKRWPARYFARLLEQLRDSNYQLILMGTCWEVALGSEILNQIETARLKVINLIGKTTMVEAIHLAATAAAVIANDSGLLHVAEALDTPMLGLYGSQGLCIAPPLGPRSKAVFADPAVVLRGEFPPLPGERRSMSALQPEVVYEALLSLLEETRPAL